MSKGIIYLMSSVVSGLIKIGSTQDFEGRMRKLESDGYKNVTGLKREFAIELKDYESKENLLHNIFSKSQVGDSELFTLDINLVIQLLSAFDGTIVYPINESKETIFINATDAVEEKQLSINRHHFKEIDFSSSLTNKKYHGKRNDEGTLSIIDLGSGTEVPNNANPSKKAIIGRAIEDLGGSIEKEETLYQRYRKLSKLVLKDDKDNDD